MNQEEIFNQLSKESQESVILLTKRRDTSLSEVLSELIELGLDVYEDIYFESVVSKRMKENGYYDEIFSKKT